MSDCQGKNWVVIVAGSNGWRNYRHQADACHAYQIVHRNGIPDEQIVVMMYDDIANNKENPTPGIIINRPNGPNVYKGVPKDYTGKAVTPENFLAVLRGDSRSGKALNSGPNDHVFVYFTDHGGPGILGFPHGVLHVSDLSGTLQYMYNNKKYKKMVFYIEACRSGSMMTRLPPNMYATTASNAQEPSYSCYYDGKLKAWLGDLYSVSWMENSDEVSLKKETLELQFKITKNMVYKRSNAKQHVQEFGDMNVSQMTLMEFQGNSCAGAQPAEPMNLLPVDIDDVIPSCDVYLDSLKRELLTSDDMSAMRGLLMEIEAHLKVRDTLKEFMLRVVERVTGDQKILDERMELSQSQHENYKTVVTYFKNCFDWNETEYEYALTHLYALVNLCESGHSTDSIQKAMDYAKATSK